MEKSESLKNYGNNTYSLNGVMEYLNEQIHLLTEKETSWQDERQMLQRKIAQLQSELSSQRALNNEMMKKMKHRRTSSQEKTFIFNQTNISSYYPIVVMPKASWTCKKNLRSHLDSIRALAWHGDYLISSGEDCLMKFWQSGELVSTVREHLGPVYTMTTNKDSLYTAGSEGVLRHWDLSSLAKGNIVCLYEKQLHTDVVWQVNHHPTASLLLSSSADGLIQLFRTDLSLHLEHHYLRKTNNGEQLFTPTSLDWLSSEKFATSYLQFADIVVYDIATKQIVNAYGYKSEQRHHQANKVIFNEHNGLIMSAHEDKMIRFMDPHSDKIVKSLVAHTDSVTSLTFQAKSYEFSSSSHDGSVRAWDIRKFKCLSHVPIHCRKYDEAANCLLQHPHDMIIAVGGADGIVKVLYESE